MFKESPTSLQNMLNILHCNNRWCHMVQTRQDKTGMGAFIRVFLS